MLCKDFLNSLEEKITAHYGTIYLISFTNKLILKKMQKIMLIFVALIAFCTIGVAQPAETQREGKTVSETIKALDAEWRMMYKIMGESIVYDNHYQLNTTTNKYELKKDTSSIYKFNINQNGRTLYTVNREDVTGQLVVNDWDISGTWDLKQTADGIDLHIMNAYYPGCPTIIRRIINVNGKQLLLQDSETGTQYYYVKR